jgi:hypothetical protein
MAGIHDTATAVASPAAIIFRRGAPTQEATCSTPDAMTIRSNGTLVIMKRAYAHGKCDMPCSDMSSTGSAMPGKRMRSLLSRETVACNPANRHAIDAQAHEPK